MARKETVYIVGAVQLYQRARYWQASYSTPTGRVRRSLKVTNLKVAQKKAQEITQLIEQGDFTPLQDQKAHAKRTFAEFAEEFCQKHGGWAKSTWYSNRIIIRIVTETWGEMPLVSINAHIIESYIAKREVTEGVTIATSNRYLAVIKTLMKKAKAWGYITHNPAQQVSMQKEDNRVPHALRDDQVEALLEHLAPHNRDIAVFALETGMRRGELFGLCWSHIDLANRWITVEHTKNHDFRVIPMSDRVYEILTKLARKKKGPYVLGRNDGRPRDGIRNALDKASADAGIGHVHLHMLRHTFATRLRDRGVPLDRIKEFLGHKGMTMTLRYAKCTPTQLKTAIEVLNGPEGLKEVG